MQNLSPLTYPNLKADKTEENASCNVLQTYEYKLKGYIQNQLPSLIFWTHFI